MNVLACTDCGWRTFYDRRRCPACGGASFAERDPGDGELLATTTVHVTPDGVETPNRLGLARFEGNADVIAQLTTDADAGTAVEFTGEQRLRETDEGVVVGSRLTPADLDEE